MISATGWENSILYKKPAINSTAALLTINKYEKRAKDWYNAQEELAKLPWGTLKKTLKLAFWGNTVRPNLLAEMQARRWTWSQKVEEYYYEKARLLYTLDVLLGEMIFHVIRRIDNTIQLKIPKYEPPEDLFSAMKSYADELLIPTTNVEKPRKIEKLERSRGQSAIRFNTNARCYNRNFSTLFIIVWET